jgi:phospholipid-translocating ATPase
MCLAIGDGANDVSMIQEADIGIGISGKEGLQAAMAGDYSIAQFRFLTRLLLVHGKWAYIRSSSMVLNYFYKNLVWILIQFWHQFYSGFNAAIIFEITYSMFFNTVFTVLPTLFIGVFDQDINATISLLVPQIYAKGIKQELYTSIRFWEITAVAIYQSIACYFVGFAFVNDVSDGANGSYDVQYLGTTVAFGAILVINVYSISHWYNWTYLTHVALWSSFVSWTAYVLLFSTAKDSPAYGLLEILFKAPNFYLAVILMSFVSMLPILVFKFTQQLLYPSDTDIVREIQALHKHYDWVSGPIASFQTIQGPKTEQSGVSSFLNGSASKLSASEDKKAASSSNMVKIKMDKKASSDGFGDNQHSNKRRFPKLLGEAEINRSRPPSSGLGNAIKIAGDFMKKISGNDKHKVGRHSSLVYMGKDGGLRPNTGFAFSHDTGMEDVITPKGRLMPVLEEPARKPAKLRNISDKLSYVLAGKKKETSE